ncbi:Methyltransferase [uncultured virus]|nr:Methyltransferase [uncultured virus]
MALVYNDLGLAKTLNGYGIMTKFNMVLTQAFLNNIQDKDILEIGPAFGRNVREILRKCKSYTAIDLDSRHLDYLRSHACNPSELDSNQDPKGSQVCNISKLTTICGKFPNVDLDDASFDVILIERVLHFFTPYEIDLVLATLYRILRPGGTCYILTSQPDNKLLVGRWTYNLQRWLRFSHPGFLNLAILKYLFHERWIHRLLLRFFEPSDDRRRNQLELLGRVPDTIYFMSEYDLFKLLRKHKFSILSIGREHYPLPSDTELCDTWDTVAVIQRLK